jgi:hypothetical protein
MQKKRLENNIIITVAAMVAAALFVSPAEVFAWATPAAGAVFYSGWDFFVNDLLKGPVGSMAGMGIIAHGAIIAADATKGGLRHGVPWLVVGGILNQLDTVSNTFGYTV